MENLNFGEIADAANSVIRDKVKSVFLSSQTELNAEVVEARSKILGVVFWYLTKINKMKPLGADQKNVVSSLGLAMYFLQNAEDVWSQIFNGKYVLACASLKQEMEMIARGNALLNKKAKEGKLAHIDNYPGKNGKVLYGLINDVAHVSKDDISLGLITKTGQKEKNTTIYIYPNFNKTLFWGLIGIHIGNCGEIALLVLNLFESNFSNDKKEMLIARQTLVKCHKIFGSYHAKAMP